MYRYDSIDQQLIDERVAQYRDQIERNRAGTLSDDELRPLRLPLLVLGIPAALLSLAIAHLALWFGWGSKLDPLGYGLIARIVSRYVPDPAGGRRRRARALPLHGVRPPPRCTRREPWPRDDAFAVR